jgi:hypothetical protein
MAILLSQPKAKGLSGTPTHFHHRMVITAADRNAFPGLWLSPCVIHTLNLCRKLGVIALSCLVDAE